MHISKKSSTFAPAFKKATRSGAVGSALRSGRRGRVFESRLLDKKDIRWVSFFVFLCKCLHMSEFLRTFAPDLFWNSVRKKLIILFLGLMSGITVMADDVVYLSTSLFRERIFDFATEKEWSYKGDKPCVIDFYTTWCGPCKLLAPIMDELSQTYCDQVVFYKVDTERERPLAYFFGINSIPQVLYIPMEGQPRMYKGLYPKENIIRIIDEFLLKKGEQDAR